MSEESDIIMQMGDLSSEDIQRVLNQVKAKGYGSYNLDEGRMQNVDQYTQEFLHFIQDALEGSGLTKDIATGVEVSPRDYRELRRSPEKFIKAIWDKRAKTWAAIESPYTYIATMATLLYFFQTNPKKNERYLSLGSGPGLYEAFLGAILQETLKGQNIKIFAADISQEMTRFNNSMLGHLATWKGNRIKVVQPVTQDMSHLQFPNGFIDQIICNNSLQWVPDWKKAISEMARVLNPNGLGNLYLFINNNPMHIRRPEGPSVLTLGGFSAEELLDTLETNRFGIIHTRQFTTKPGLGQMGHQADRLFVFAQHLRKSEEQKSWRRSNINASVSFY